MQCHTGEPRGCLFPTPSKTNLEPQPLGSSDKSLGLPPCSHSHPLGDTHTGQHPGAPGTLPVCATFTAMGWAWKLRSLLILGFHCLPGSCESPSSFLEELLSFGYLEETAKGLYRTMGLRAGRKGNWAGGSLTSVSSNTETETLRRGRVSVRITKEV